jgi:hypothetical protein
VSHISPAACEPSILQPGPRDYNSKAMAKAGPIWLSAFGDAVPGGPARLADGGRLDGWKVLIHPDPNAAGTAVLTGKDCESGEAIRFCYTQAGCTWDTRLDASVALLEIDLSKKTDFNGYMLFPKTGLMHLKVSIAARDVGSVTLDVPSA